MILVIGYGNELRRDDAVGLLAARAVASWAMPGVVAMESHGLLPEMAEPLSRAERAVFVDAGERAETLRVVPQMSPSLCHTGGPGWLLALAEAAYGRAPVAWLVTVPIADLGHGEGMTETARAGLAIALEEVRQCMRSA